MGAQSLPVMPAVDISTRIPDKIQSQYIFFIQVRSVSDVFLHVIDPLAF
jgi:hypothetical protein